jgi:hypothetical protein
MQQAEERNNLVTTQDSELLGSIELKAMLWNQAEGFREEEPEWR